MERFTIVGLGEALVDMFPDRQHVGGAPLNAAVMAHQLASHLGGKGIPVSRVGQDAPGQMILSHLAELGVDTGYLQTDPDLRTGRAYIQLDDHDNPTCDIIQNVAWEVMQYDPDLEELANDCDAVCYGTLAQRHPQSRQTIMRFLAQARRAIRLFDVNLRQPWYDAASIERGIEYATILKANESELPIVTGLLGHDDTKDADTMATTLLERYNLQMVVVTRGRAGTVIHTNQGRFEEAKQDTGTSDSNNSPNEQTAEDAQAAGDVQAASDAIGAGDAACAALLVGACMRYQPRKLARMANVVGAWVAPQPGATQAIPQELLKKLFSA